MKSKRLYEQYKDYPEGSGGKKIYDHYTMDFKDFLSKYYLDQIVDWSRWLKWQKKYIEPAFDKNRHKELIQNFGYVSEKSHNFKFQNTVYLELLNYEKLDEETKRFISFMAGAGFFDKVQVTLSTWFNSKNWTNPKGIGYNQKYTLNEILQFENGLNYIKTCLVDLPFWDR